VAIVSRISTVVHMNLLVGAWPARHMAHGGRAQHACAQELLPTWCDSCSRAYKTTTVGVGGIFAGQFGKFVGRQRDVQSPAPPQMNLR